MKLRLPELGTRRGLALWLGGAVLLLVAAYGLLRVAPAGRIEKLQGQIREQRATLAWMRQAALEVRRLRPAEGRGDARQSPAARVDRSVRAAGLGPAIAGIEPDGEDKVRIVLEQASFRALAGWLQGLPEREGLEPERVSIEGGSGPGIVNARITLGSTGP